MGGRHRFQSCLLPLFALLLGTSRERDDSNATSALPGMVCDKSWVSERAPEQGWLALRLLGSCGESVLRSVPLLVNLCWLNEAACILAAQLLQVPFFEVTKEPDKRAWAATCFCRQQNRVSLTCPVNRTMSGLQLQVYPGLHDYDELNTRMA